MKVLGERQHHAQDVIADVVIVNAAEIGHHCRVSDEIIGIKARRWRRERCLKPFERFGGRDHIRIHRSECCICLDQAG
jgi:hypothetical protein